MSICKFCGKEMAGASSCANSHILIDGKKYSPVPYKEKNSGTIFRREQKRCPECNVMPRGFHHLGCGMEICPKCGGRWISCRCFGRKIRIGECESVKCKIIPFRRV